MTVAELPDLGTAGRRERLGRLARLAVDLRARRIARRVGRLRAKGRLGALDVLAYRGYGTREAARLSGRVVRHKPIRAATDEDSLWRNLRNTYRRLTRLPIPGARLRARLGRETVEVCADELGFFDAVFTDLGGLPTDRLWHPVRLELVEPGRQAEAGGEAAEVLLPGDRARTVIISDIDDTVLPAQATRFVRMMLELFTTNPHTRLPFPGVAALYRGLHRGPGGDLANPVLYVSRGPWNLYDLLCQLFELHDIPVGPILYLREWGLSAEGLGAARPRGHKYRLIEAMLNVYSELPFILVGDSGQLDPEIYAEVVAEHPGRVQVVYIRSIDRSPDRLRAIAELAARTAATGTDLVLADDTAVMARHALEHGWIGPEALSEVEAESEHPATG